MRMRTRIRGWAGRVRARVCTDCAHCTCAQDKWIDRTLPDGTKLTWELLWLHKMSGTWPFFIDWLDAPHPSVDSPKVGALLAFTVDLPVDDSNRLPFETPARVELRTGAPRMSLAFESIRGPIEWSADDPKGFFLYLGGT